MPLIRGKLDEGRRILVDIGVQPTLHTPDSVKPEHQPATMHILPLRGLIDTGAQVTCITRSAAAAVGLVPRGKRRIGNVSTFEMHNAYSFVLGVWHVPVHSADGRATGYYQFEPVYGVDFKDSPDFDVLIGMDIIVRGDLTVYRSGEFIWDLP